MKLQFKFRLRTPENQRLEVLAMLKREGAAARRLFPQETDEELAGLHVVEVVDQASGRRVLDLLRGSPAVEFAEREARRRLIP